LIMRVFNHFKFSGHYFCKLNTCKKLKKLIPAAFAMRPGRLAITIVVVRDGCGLSLGIFIIETFAVVTILDG